MNSKAIVNTLYAQDILASRFWLKLNEIDRISEEANYTLFIDFVDEYVKILENISRKNNNNGDGK